MSVPKNKSKSKDLLLFFCVCVCADGERERVEDNILFVDAVFTVAFIFSLKVYENVSLINI